MQVCIAQVRIAAVLAGISVAAPALAADGSADAAPAATTEAAPARLAALPPLAPAVGEESQAATDASGGSTLLWSALYGGLAGALIGGGIALLEGDHYGRDIGIGAGAGIIIGAGLGAAHVFGDRRGLAARDGLGSPDRDPVLTAHTFGVGARF